VTAFASASASDQKLLRPLSRRPAGHVPPTVPLRREVGAPPRTAVGQRAGLITVVVADDEPLIRAGIRSVLERAQGLEVVAEAADGHRAVALVRGHRPDVLIVDVAMPAVGGLAVTELVRRDVPDTEVIVMVTDAVDDLIFGALRAGASGFLLKQCAPAELVNAVLAVAAGHAALAPRATRRLVDQFLGVDLECVHRARRMIDALTSREREVLAKIARGMGNAEIARTLYLSEGAVKAHVSRLLTKLDCTNRVQAATLSHHASLLQW
jgi:DNA-binding NarL/FixJ family response regulator